jgi:hypothetical protein
MSNPIADGVFYVEESQHSYRVDEKKRDYDDEYEEDYFTPNHRRQSMDASRWHSLFRRMSINVQRDEGTPDKELVIGTPLHPSDHERTLMLNMPIPEEMPEDNSLPSVDEVNRENKNCVEKKSYFEHPFESESSSMDETVTAINPPPESKPIVLTDEGLVSSPVDLKHEQADQSMYPCLFLTGDRVLTCKYKHRY